MKNAIYPGTFDPITIGHLDIIERSSKIFDKLIVAIMQNPSKKHLFSEIERKKMLEKCVKKYSNVKVVIGSGLTVAFAKSKKCNVIVRGIRAISDYEYELAQASTNMQIDNEVETFLLVAKPQYSFLSSSIIKQLAYFEGDIKNYIPKAIHNDFIKKIKTLNKENL